MAIRSRPAHGTQQKQKQPLSYSSHTQSRCLSVVAPRVFGRERAAASRRRVTQRHVAYSGPARQLRCSCSSSFFTVRRASRSHPRTEGGLIPATSEFRAGVATRRWRARSGQVINVVQLSQRTHWPRLYYRLRLRSTPLRVAQFRAFLRVVSARLLWSHPACADAEGVELHFS